MRFFVFGTGRFYRNRREQLLKCMQDDTCIGFLDNHRTGNFEGKPIYVPEDGVLLPFDSILLMSTSAMEMCNQLLRLGVSGDRILFWKDVLPKENSGKLRVNAGRRPSSKGKKILIVTQALAYNGGAMAAVYAGKALRSKGYEVVIATSMIDSRLLQETREMGLTIIECSVFPYVFSGERAWIEWFDIVLVNVFPMMVSAIEISKFRPVLWWIHESEDRYTEQYSHTRTTYPQYADLPGIRARIFAVSPIAEKAFEKFYPHHLDGSLPYGIPDTYQKLAKNVDHLLTMALLGEVTYLKAQRDFLNAISILSGKLRFRCKFYIIGRVHEGVEYDQDVLGMARQFPEVCMTGVLTRRELQELYPNLDVIVSPSYVDSLPIAVTEGLMNKKICIVSDATGQAQGIIHDGENGFICKAGNPASLAEKMTHVIEHFDELGSMREKARKTYEQYFSMEAFGERLERELLLTEREYWE